MKLYFNGAKIGCGSILDLPFTGYIPEQSNILLISSPTVSSSSKVTEFISKLKTKGDIKIFDNIKPDAPLPDLEFIIENYSKPGLLIAIGGGSVIDSAKALSVGWNQSSLKDYFSKKSDLPTNKIPLIAIPTTAGTGAELSYGAIIYDEENNVKGGLRGEILQPVATFIDADLYLTAPSKLIAETGFDCLTHAVETYISKASSPIIRMQSVSAINTFFNQVDKAVKKDREGMEKMAVASALMGVNLALSSTCLPHRIQYALRKFRPHSHAEGLICLYKGWLEEVRNTSAFEELAQDLNLTSSGLVDKINRYKKVLGIDYSLSEFGFDYTLVEKIAGEVSGNLEVDPSYQSSETLINIIKNSL